jgi:hypothetical protein
LLKSLKEEIEEGDPHDGSDGSHFHAAFPHDFCFDSDSSLFDEENQISPDFFFSMDSIDEEMVMKKHDHENYFVSPELILSSPSPSPSPSISCFPVPCSRG